MIMSGSTIAPLFGGVLVQAIGYPALGVAAIVFSLFAAALYAASRKYESGFVGVPPRTSVVH